MNHQDSAFVLSALLDATDPATGQSLSDPLFARRDIKTALATARNALTRDTQPKRPANAGKPWTEEHDQALTSAFAKGSSAAALSRQLGRSLAAIEARLIHHGLLKPEEATCKLRY